MATWEQGRNESSHWPKISTLSPAIWCIEQTSDSFLEIHVSFPHVSIIDRVAIEGPMSCSKARSHSEI